MTVNRYDKRDEIRLTGTFTDSDGTAADPDAVLLVVEDPDNAEVGYVYGWTDGGSWDAGANSPTLADGTGTAGDYYTVSVAGSVDLGSGSITYAVGEVVYYNGFVWQRLESLSSTALTKSGTGIYYGDVYAEDSGHWHYSFEGLGTGQSGDEGKFYVKGSHR